MTDPRRDHRLLNVSPADDAGSRTQARYAFQHQCTARIALGMLVDNRLVAVVCETHEDVVAIYRDGVAELVSIKHRDDGHWRLTDLRPVLEGLFGHWRSTGRCARSRLVTNGRPAGGRGQARELFEACREGDGERLVAWAEKTWQWLGAADHAEAVTFLSTLTIDQPTGDLEHIAAVNLVDVVEPVLRGLDLQPHHARGCYERVLDQVARCNRDEPIDPDYLLRYLADPDRERPEARRRARLERRSLDRQRLLGCLVEPEPPGSAPQLKLEAPTTEGTQLRRKLIAGALGSNTIAAALVLRANWAALEARWRNDAPGGDPSFRHVWHVALDEAAKAERACGRREPYGLEMHRLLDRTLTVESLGRRPPFPLDDRLLRGLLYQLTDECHVWWSPRPTS